MAVESPPFVDTNVLLYVLSDDGLKSRRAEAVLAAGVVISVQVLNEFANVCRRKMGLTWTETLRALADVQLFAEVLPLTMDTHSQGLALAERYRWSVYDGMIVAAALMSGCTRLLSEDLQSGQRVAGKLSIVNPFV